MIDRKRGKVKIVCSWQMAVGSWQSKSALYLAYLAEKGKNLSYDLQNFLTRSPVMEAFSQLLPSLGLQSRRMVIILSATL